LRAGVGSESPVEGVIPAGAEEMVRSVRQLEPTDVIGVTFDTSPEGIGPESGAAYQRLYDLFAEEEISPTGPPRLVYHRMSENTWTIECCVPVAGVTEAPHGLYLRAFPGGRVARTLHVGPYEELGMAYRELEVWVDQQGLTTSAPPFDVYLNDPHEVEDPARFETELVWPVGT
jgi:effector-binding domain-containing protein